MYCDPDGLYRSPVERIEANLHVGQVRIRKRTAHRKPLVKGVMGASGWPESWAYCSHGNGYSDYGIRTEWHERDRTVRAPSTLGRQSLAAFISASGTTFLRWFDRALNLYQPEGLQAGGPVGSSPPNKT
jgi:hypothetical protein